MTPAERPSPAELQALLESKTLIEAHFESRNTGGYSAQLLGYRAFLPGSHSLVPSSTPFTEDPLVTTTAPVVIIEVQSNPLKIVISRREAKDQLAATEKAARQAKHQARLTERESQRGEQFTMLSVGDIVEATGRYNIARPGGGTAVLQAGLTKIRVEKVDLGYGTPAMPEPGQTFTCLITGIDSARQFVYGSIKRLLPDPWDTVADRHLVGSERLVRIESIVNFGLFAELEPGVDCLVHRSEIPGADATTVLAHHFASGDQILVVLTSVNAEQRRIGAAPVVATLPNSEADRRREVQQIFEQNSAGSPEVLRNLAGAMRGVQGDMYWAVDRFVFELLQNADDLPARPGGSVRVQVRLLPNFLVFQHNGLPFRHEHVVALANVNQSTKKSDATTTGYKGIGFKSVYSESSCVYVRSGGYSFRFASEANEDVPWQTWPRWIEAADYPPELRADDDFFNDALFPVSFGLQIQPGKCAIYADELRKLFRDPRFALFLRSLDNIRVVGEGLEEIQLTRTRLLDTDQIVFDALGQQSAYLRHEYPVTIDDKFKPSKSPNIDDAPPAKLPDKLLGVDTVTVQFAAALDPDTNDLVPMNPAEAALSAYLPTEDVTYGLPLLINADFTLTSSREKVTLNNQWNEFLFHQVGRLLIQWLADRLRHQPAYARHIYQFIPPAQEANKNQQALTAGVQEGIQSIPCLPAADHNDLVLLTEAVLDQAGLYPLLPDIYADYVNDGLTVVHQSATGGVEAADLVGRFGLRCIKLVDIQAAFRKADITNCYTPADAARLLCHLAADSTTVPTDWRSVPWLFTQQGELVAPNDTTLYGALSEDWVSSFPLASKVRFLHPQLQEVLRTSPEVSTWVETMLRISPCTQRSAVRDLLLPAVGDAATDSDTYGQCVLYLYGLHQRQELQTWLTETDRKWLAAMNVLCDDSNYHKVANCYLSCHYAPPFELEALADDLGKAQFPLVSEIYLSPFDEPADWREFWNFCGIRSPDATELLNIRLLPTNTQTTTWSAAKHEAVLLLALDAFAQGQGQKLPLAELPKLKARTAAGLSALPGCVLPPAHNPHLALLTQLPLSPIPNYTLAADYFNAGDPAAVANFFQFAGCKPWTEAATLSYACHQLLTVPLDLAASVAAVRQLYQWKLSKQLQPEHQTLLNGFPFYQQDNSTRPANNTYFSSHYGPKHDIEVLTNGKQKKLLTEAYLPSDVSDAERTRWKEFFEELGVVGEFEIHFHASVPRATAEQLFPSYLAWADANPAICPLPYGAPNFRSQHSLQNFISFRNLDLMSDEAVARLLAQKIEVNSKWFLDKPAPAYHTTYGNHTWPAGSLLNAFPVVPCTGTPALRPAHEVYSRHLAVVPAGAPVATVTYGSLLLEERLGLQTQLNPVAALELLAQASVSCQAGQPVTDQARSLFAKTLVQVQPWLTDKAKIPAAWRTKLLLPAANNTWLSASQAHLVTNDSLYLKTSGAILHELPRTLTNEKYQVFAEALSIPILTEKEFKLTTFAATDTKPQTREVLQRFDDYQLFALLCEYRSLPPSQATTWAEEAKKLSFAQVPAIQRECTVIADYRLTSGDMQHVEGQNFYFVGYLWSACHWQALAGFLVKQLGLRVPFHVVIRLLESNERAAQMAVFEQAGYPVPTLLQNPAPLIGGTVLTPVGIATDGVVSNTSLSTYPVKRVVSVAEVDILSVPFKPDTRTSFVEVLDKPVLDNKPDSSERVEIGRWCEELVYDYLMASQDTYSHIEWPNQNQESYKPYDFVVKRNGITTYIEVKGTPSLQKDIIYLSAAEWFWMLKHKECYSILRVYGALSATPKIEEINAPGPKVLSGELIPHAIELQV